MGLLIKEISMLGGALVALAASFSAAIASDDHPYFGTVGAHRPFCRLATFKPALELSSEESMALAKREPPLLFEHSRSIRQISLQADDAWLPATRPDSAVSSASGSVPFQGTSTTGTDLAWHAQSGLRPFALRQTTIKTVLADLRKKFGSACATQSGNFHWFVDTQRSWVTGNKTANLVACNKASRWFNLCVSSDTKEFNLYFTGR